MNTSFRHMKGATIFLAVTFCLSLSATAQQSFSPFVLYDNFNHELLDPNKWEPSGACFTRTTFECAREIQNGQLRLAVRGAGATDSNSGSQYAESQLYFTNPSLIKSISSQLTIRRTSAAMCPANTDFNAGTQALVKGTFFNSGSGDPADDVEAFVLVTHVPTDPPGVLEVIAFLNWQGQFFDNIYLGKANVGQKIVLQLNWSETSHQFVAGWTDVASGIVTQLPMPYSMPDTAPAAVPFKNLEAAVFAPNCVGTQMLTDDMEAIFDNVMVGK